MAKGELEFDDLHDFFERSYDVTTQSDTSWLFTSTSAKFAGYTVEFRGDGLIGTGLFPEGGTIARVIITGPEGVTDDVDGLALAATDLAAEFEIGDDEEGGGDDKGDDGDDDLTGDDGDDDLSGHGGDDDLLGGGGDDDLSGGGGDDDLSGDDGDDDLSGGGGDDELSGDDGSDDLRGAGGDDDLNGGLGDDHLTGNGGKDDLSGDEGNDLLKGNGKGDDLDGGADDDLLIGGGGKDTYIFGLDFGDDVIKRFDAGKDKIDLIGLGIVDFDSEVDIDKDDNGDTIVTTAEGTITIDKIAGGKTVDDSDFLIS